MPYKDPAKQRAYCTSWMKARRDSYFDSKACVRCGATELLELDHIDPAEKTSHRIWSWREERRAAEMAKCQVLCRACHKAKSWEQQGWGRHGIRARYNKGCRCEPCRAASTAAARVYRARKRQQGIASS